jgi:hypothetical protein
MATATIIRNARFDMTTRSAIHVPADSLVSRRDCKTSYYRTIIRLSTLRGVLHGSARRCGTPRIGLL